MQGVTDIPAVRKITPWLLFLLWVFALAVTAIVLGSTGWLSDVMDVETSVRDVAVDIAILSLGSMTVFILLLTSMIRILSETCVRSCG